MSKSPFTFLSTRNTLLAGKLFFPKNAIRLLRGYNKTMIAYDIEPTDNKRLLLLRELDAHRQHVGEIIYVTPETLERQYGIDLQTIQSVLSDLEELGHIEIEQTPNRKLTYAQKVRKDDEQDYYLVTLKDSFANYYEMLEQTEKFHRANLSGSATSPPDPMTATLSFESITVPVISIGGEKYRLASMREGLPHAIISYCLEKHPNETIDLDTLKSELKAAGIKAHGLSNLREDIRKSHFGDKKPCSPFVTVSPKAILVRQSTILTRQHINALKAAQK
jgi:hypothetical protein